MTWTTRPRSELAGLAAITAGQGPLVLMIHGVGLRAEAWGAQIDTLAQTSRVVAIDLPGHGQSAALQPDADLAAFTRSIVACLDRPAAVIGHSFGAMIALDMAIRYPDRVQKVAAFNAIHRRDEKAKAAVVARADALKEQAATDPSATLNRWFGNAASPQRDACRDWLFAVDPSGYRNAYRVFAREDGPCDTGLQSLACPALFVTGRLEPNSTPEMSQNMAARVPGARCDILDGAAHMLPMTHAPQVNAILAEFLGVMPDDL